MSIKISELPSASSVNTGDVIPIVQSGTTKKVTVGTMMPVIATSITSSSTNNEVAGAKAVYDFTSIKYLSLYRASAWTLSATSSYTVIPLNEFENIGGLFNFDTTTNQVSVSVASKLSVNINISIQAASSSGLRYIRIRKNGYGVYTIINTVAGSTALTFCASNIMVDMTPTDKLDFAMYGYSGDKIDVQRCFITIVAQPYSDTQTRTLNALLMNTGSLVGMGDRAEVSEQVDEKVDEQVTDNDFGKLTKSAEVDKLESEEGSGDSR